ncbi:ERAD-associated E3 ubiquitin-protein ligase HRD1B-like [Silene latifolia]|uniref:ERAD-associated E3 ubiquitin-protein ligase HRD1B-like n=1 Tax=Silene latifolia TaxID=37657 RepID=UPI003D775F52
MVRLQPYAGLSVFATLAVIYHAFHTRRQFYPAMLYLSTSKISLVILLNMGLVIMCSLWQLSKRLFLGSLREAEVERLNEQSWREVMEILFAITIFRQDFSVSFLTMVTALLLIKSLHWLAQKRVEFIETTPAIPKLTHLRIVSFLGFLLLLDSLFLYSSVKSLIETQQASVSIFFSFEYMILATTTVAMFVKYIFYVSDMLMEGQWEKKAVCTFYLELIRDLLHLSMYLCFFMVIFVNYGVPLHLIRELYETFRNFKIRIADYIRYRKITSNMNDRFPDATPEELDVSDVTCIICREEMTIAKKLRCGHLFHVQCLRSWLERQNTCPTCRALVVPPETGTSTVPGQHGVQAGASQTASTSASGQSSTSGNVTSSSLNGNEARLQAQAAAAAVYEKSLVYPSNNTLMWCPGYAVLPQVHGTSPCPINGEFGDIQHLTAQLGDVSGQMSFSLPQLPPFAVSPTPVPNGDVISSGISLLPVDSQRNLIEHQIQALQKELEILRQQQLEKGASSSSAPRDSNVENATSTSDATSSTNIVPTSL